MSTPPPDSVIEQHRFCSFTLQGHKNKWISAEASGKRAGRQASIKACELLATFEEKLSGVEVRAPLTPGRPIKYSEYCHKAKVIALRSADSLFFSKFTDFYDGTLAMLLLLLPVFSPHRQRFLGPVFGDLRPWQRALLAGRLVPSIKSL